MRKRAAFTFIELVFVLVVMAIIAKFGVEFMAQAYKDYIYQHINNTLADRSSAAVEFIANRLKYRVKDSVIVRHNTTGVFRALEGENNLPGYDVLEWIGYDIEGFRGNSAAAPLWSGLIDKEYAHATPIPTDIYSPGTNTANVSALISALSNGGSDINDSAIYIMSSDSDVYTDYGWNGTAITDQNHTMHPINSVSGDPTKFVSANAQSFAALNDALKDARYKLAWSAYAVVYTPGNNFDGNLTLYYDYQPWNGESYTNGKSTLIMEHVSAFRKRQSFHVIKIQVCTKSEFAAQATASDMEKYSVCKEKTIY